MKVPRLLFAVILCFVIPASTFSADATSGYKVVYDGGSLADTKVGTGMKLVISGDHVTFLNDKNNTQIANIPASTITEISYGQDVHRRVGAAIGLAVVSFGIGGLMALTKSKKHYVGLTWADGDKKGGFAMQCDKGDYRGVLAALVSCPGDFVSTDATLRVGVSPTKWFGGVGVGANVFPQFAS